MRDTGTGHPSDSADPTLPTQSIRRAEASETAGKPADLGRFLSDIAQLEPSERASRLRLDQRGRWLRGERVLAEEYLNRRSQWCAEHETALDIIYQEYVLRQEQGERPQVEEYLARFPQYREQLERLLALDCELAAGPPKPEEGSSAGARAPAIISAGQRIGKYAVVARLDSGGQADVFRAVHPTLGTDVVIKLSHAALLDDAERGRLLAEGRILADLRHVNLAQVHDFDLHQGRPYLVMEFVRGQNLKQYARQHALLPRAAATLVAGVARAVALAHKRGITHQDIKPQNILIDDSGMPRLIDFGLARLQNAWREDPVDPGSISGTVGFMAPEQARGETDRIGPRSDVFALGGVLYYLLTARAPFTAQSLSAALGLAQRGEWDWEALCAPRIPRRLRAICTRAMAADQAARFANAEDLADDLEAFAHKRRLRALWLVPVGLLLVFGAVAWWQGWLGAKERTTDSKSTHDTPAASEPGSTSKERAPAVRLDPSKAHISVRVKRNGRYLNLLDCAPVRSGEGIQIQVDVPEDMYVGLFLITSQGTVKLLEEMSPASSRHVLRYPKEADGDFVPVQGKAGTDVLVVCARRDASVRVEELAKLVPLEKPWPTLTEPFLLRLVREEVRTEPMMRDLGGPQRDVGPTADVRRRLEALRGLLSERFAFFEAVAFAHQ